MYWMKEKNPSSKIWKSVLTPIAIPTKWYEENKLRGINKLSEVWIVLLAFADKITKCIGDVEGAKLTMLGKLSWGSFTNYFSIWGCFEIFFMRVLFWTYPAWKYHAKW